MRSLSILLLALAAVAAKQCADPQFSCPESSTCCLLEDGQYGCCPMQNAVCCEDHTHCCPEGAQCDVEEGRCLQSNGDFFPLHSKSKAHRTAADVVCPGGRSKCPEGTTCCEMSSGQFGCCPVPNAVCCADHMHCCPDGYRCDSSGGRCINREDAMDVISWLRKSPSHSVHKKTAISLSKPKQAPSARVACGYGHACPLSNTCCAVSRVGGMEMMCCPLSNAVCCEESCCPQGYRCLPGGRCEKHATRVKSLFGLDDDDF